MNKVTRAFPVSPTKRKTVLARILSKMNDADKLEVVTAITPTRKNYVPNALLIKEIREFYERDDISRTSPKIRDVKEYVSVDTGEKILLPTRHMILTMKEAFALFDEERKNAGKGIWN